jgi:hypothetical protein
MAKNPVGRKTIRKRTARKTSRVPSRNAAPKHKPTPDLYGWITHTEFASSDPAATKAWCATVLGWTFKPSFSTPGGEYHLFTYSDKGGGGIFEQPS